MAFPNVKTSVPKQTSLDPFQTFNHPLYLTMDLYVEGWGESQVIFFGIFNGKNIGTMMKYS